MVHHKFQSNLRTAKISGFLWLLGSHIWLSYSFVTPCTRWWLIFKWSWVIYEIKKKNNYHPWSRMIRSSSCILIFNSTFLFYNQNFFEFSNWLTFVAAMVGQISTLDGNLCNQWKRLKSLYTHIKKFNGIFNSTVIWRHTWWCIRWYR